MKKIRCYGLLTRREREAVGARQRVGRSGGGRISSRGGGCDGIHTYHADFGCIGGGGGGGRLVCDSSSDDTTVLVVARLHGKTTRKFDTARDVRLRSRLKKESPYDTQFNCEVAILRRSHQVAPLLEFSPASSLLASSGGRANALQIAQKRVQELVDELLNDRPVLLRRT